MQANRRRFRKFGTIFDTYPKSAMFKTMGYSPGFLLKIGRFRTLANSPEILPFNPQRTQNAIFKHIAGVSGSLERFSAPTQIRHVQNHGLQPRLFAQNRSISDPCEFTPNLHQQSRKQLQIYLQANRRRFRKFGTIFGTYPNPPCSKPWAIAQAFCSKSADLGPLRIHLKSCLPTPKALRMPFASTQQAFQEVWNDFRYLPKIRHLQNNGLQPRLFAQNRSISDPFEITPNLHQQSRKQLKIYFPANRRRFREFGTIFDTYPNPPCSKPWAIAQAFCSKSVDFGPLRIHPKSSPTISKVVTNIFASKQEAFQEVWNDFRHLPKSAMFKTMGYSPGFLLKIGRFRTLANSPKILPTNPESTQNAICKHIVGVSGSLERFSIPTQNPPSSKPWAIAQAFCSKSVDFGPFRIHPKSYQQSQKQLQIYLQANRRRFRKFGTIFGTYPNPPCSKPWAIAQAFCSKSADFGPLRIHLKSCLPTPKALRMPFASTQQAFQEVWNDFRYLPKIRHLQNHGLQPRLFAQNRSISDPCEFT